VEKAADSVSMTFGDGQTFAFKSVYSPSNGSLSTSFCAPNPSQNAVKSTRRKRPRSKSMTPEEVELLCDKTAVIRAMFEAEERKYERAMKKETKTSALKTATDSTTTKRVPPSPAKSSQKRKRAAGTVPDWNKIHQEQIFSRQPDLVDWHRDRQSRTEKLFGSSRTDKMSTPGLMPRTKRNVNSAAFRKPTHSAKAEKTKPRVPGLKKMVPSSNDHRFNHESDAKLNRKTARSGTPYKHNESTLKGMRSLNKKASTKPSFGMALAEEGSIPEEKCSQSPARNHKVADKDLAYNPKNVRSRLFAPTSSSKAKSSSTPQVKSAAVGGKAAALKSPALKSVAKSAMRKSKKKDWSAVKSRVDTGRKKKLEAAESPATVKKVMTGRKKVCPVKRRLSWGGSKTASAQGSGGSKDGEPATKKRRISAHPATARRWQ